MNREPKTWREKLHQIIFEADTKAGKRFDVLLFWAIALSVLAVMLESVKPIHEEYELSFFIVEWTFTILFTLEFILRLLSVKKPLKYVFSFYGLVDILSILPAYLGLWIVTGSSSLRIIRILRLLRIFRVLKLMGFLKQATVLNKALKASKQKIMVFLFAVTILTVLLGTIMYLIESGEDGETAFTSIPRSIYWAIVTLTTVGYGDIAPQTALGQFVASLVMITGYAIIAVPTGIVTSEIVKHDYPMQLNTQSCPTCSSEGHDDDAKYCNQCGGEM